MEYVVRKDMAQVVIERPRHGSERSYHEVREKDIGHRDLEALQDLPREEGMVRPHKGNQKDLSDLLGPLRGLLINSVGRKWDDVYSEIREHLSPNSTTHMHIMGHLFHFIEVKTWLAPDGKIYAKDRSYYYFRSALNEQSGQLYVHPVTNIICRAPEIKRLSWRERPKPDPNFHFVSKEKELWKVDGIWYWAIFGAASLKIFGEPAGAAYIEDAFTKQGVKIGERCRVGKRQASRHDLRRYGLENDAPAEG